VERLTTDVTIIEGEEDAITLIIYLIIYVVSRDTWREELDGRGT
jgi:hypothetical protein